MAKILIIEDDADIAAIERDYLVLSGYEVTICPDGASGLTAALEQPFDLLLLDLMLPEVDGFTISAAGCGRSRISPFSWPRCWARAWTRSGALATARTTTSKSPFLPVCW